MAQTFQTAIVEADFYINQEWIAASLCENKDKPEMECEGHCQLKKKLEKKDKQSDTQERRHEINPFISPALSETDPSTPRATVATNIMQDAHLPNQFVSDIFHPPGA